MERFRRMKTLQKFAAVHGTFHNHFNQERHLTSRETNEATAPPPWLSGGPSWPEVFPPLPALRQLETSCG